MYNQALKESFEILGEHIPNIVIDDIEEKYSIRLDNTVIDPDLLDKVLENIIN